MPELTEAQLAMTLEELRVSLNTGAKVDFEQRLEDANTLLGDRINKRQGEIDTLLAVEERRITSEMDVIHNQGIEEALEAVKAVKKDASEKDVALDLTGEQGKAQSTNPKHHLMWCGPKYGKWLLKYRAAHPKHTMDQLISDYNEYKTGGPLKAPHLKNNIAVAGWSDDKVKEAIELVYSCKCCSDKDRPKRK